MKTHLQPRLEVVVELEELATFRLLTSSDADEVRLLRDLEARSGLDAEIRGALEEALELLRRRVAGR